jgi:hypothetical protein
LTFNKGGRSSASLHELEPEKIEGEASADLGGHFRSSCQAFKGRPTGKFSRLACFYCVPCANNGGAGWMCVANCNCRRLSSARVSCLAGGLRSQTWPIYYARMPTSFRVDVSVWKLINVCEKVCVGENRRYNSLNIHSEVCARKLFIHFDILIV